MVPTNGLSGVGAASPSSTGQDPGDRHRGSSSQILLQRCHASRWSRPLHYRPPLPRPPAPTPPLACPSPVLPVLSGSLRPTLTRPGPLDPAQVWRSGSSGSGFRLWVQLDGDQGLGLWERTGRGGAASARPGTPQGEKGAPREGRAIGGWGSGARSPNRWPRVGPPTTHPCT